MYQQHFGMHTDPFPLTPKLAFVYPSRAFGETMAHLVYGIEQAEDIILITGGIGTGKTLAVNSLLSQTQRVLQPVLVNVTRLTFPELLKYVLLELAETVPGASDTPDLLQQLKRVLQERRRAGRKVLLIVDEAQHLGADTLESLRLLMNLSTPEEQCLQLVLVGQPALEETIGRRELAQLSQRIRVRYRIEPLSRQEVEAYLDHRVRVAGCQRHLFRPGAIDRIYALSQGIPRVVNILASRALLAAYVAGKAMVEPSHVRAEDLPPVTDGPDVSRPAPVRRAAVVEDVAAPAPVAAPIVPPPPEATPEAEPAPYLMWPPRHEEPGPGRKRWLTIGVPVAVALIAVLVWQWPNLAGSPPVRPVETAALSPVDSPTPARQPEPLPVDPAPGVGTRTSTPPTSSAAVATRDDVATKPATSGRPATTPTETPRERPAVRPPAAEVTVPVVQATRPAATTPPAASGELAVHVGSFHDAERATHLMQRLTAAGFAAYETQDVVDGAPWVRVYAGPYATEDEADQARKRLTEGGVVAYARVIAVGE